MIICVLVNIGSFMLFVGLARHFYGEATEINLSDDEKRYIQTRKRFDKNYAYDRSDPEKNRERLFGDNVIRWIFPI